MQVLVKLFPFDLSNVFFVWKYSKQNIFLINLLLKFIPLLLMEMNSKLLIYVSG